ncbi:TIGR04282 family arsenosugar biosynthesis glycosyltransferase [Parahaliea sp. F7430]|uniref:TIGR04282 family arsenosugar biosynthesis glycosyltransferase n=1 Tax=Sediminihaliea albiluteola TaxID=2758564 RepID=A0A7W2TU80_9GAMM|nr:TIGR04282 family arsenosugar biosynthesis glycosyltransferase [Sediminihaliea albiluteola]MBA6412001.1 TIGR04282 family arsenosugar biosynthesis glycosyltransferase [Sediminihaliea albiluteola]
MTANSALKEVLILQFARSPQPGQVKTRMQPYLSPQQACDLHEALLEWTCRRVVGAGLAELELWVSGKLDAPVFERCLALGASALRTQQGSDLGQRMQHALADALGRAQKVILIGSDCPAIDRAYLEQAIELLNSKDCVLGPAYDGGYVLIGLTGFVPNCFTAVQWGSEQVYRQTVAHLQAGAVNWGALGSLADIDRPEDLPLWQALHSTAGG